MNKSVRALAIIRSFSPERKRWQSVSTKTIMFNSMIRAPIVARAWKLPVLIITYVMLYIDILISELLKQIHFRPYICYSRYREYKELNLVECTHPDNDNILAYLEGSRYGIVKISARPQLSCCSQIYRTDKESDLNTCRGNQKKRFGKFTEPPIVADSAKLHRNCFLLIISKFSSHSRQHNARNEPKWTKMYRKQVQTTNSKTTSMLRIRAEQIQLMSRMKLFRT